LGQAVPTSKNTPGFHAKIAYTAGPLYLSGTLLYQKQKGTTGLGSGDYNSHAFDIGGRYTYEDWQFLAWYYNGTGVGTTGLFVLSDDGAGHPRDSDGFLAQVTYKIGPTKLGVNYGESKLKTTSSEVNPAGCALPPGACLLDSNDKVTAGLYHDLTANLMLVGEFSYLESKNQRGDKNKSNNINVGAFLKF
jgi:predicted porin